MTIPFDNNAIIKAVTSRLHITFKSLHVHFSQFTLSMKNKCCEFQKHSIHNSIPVLSSDGKVKTCTVVAHQ